MAAEGRLNLEEVLEVIAVDEMPADAGPITFVAFVRAARAGKTTFTFEVRPAARPDEVAGRYPLEAEVPDAYVGRQVAVQMKVPSIPVTHGGWYDVRFVWEERILAVNRFAIGLKSGGTDA
jgi:hypothetical protein